MKPGEILDLLCVKAVLLPIRRGTKSPSRKGWPKISFEESLNPSYQRSLDNAPAIGVSLGNASQGLCTIDFDDDEALDEFLALNPSLKHTLRTTAKRGANLWLIMEGEFPASRKLSGGGKAIGEWRATGNQTIIRGQHPEGVEYRLLSDANPLRLKYNQIVWPAHWQSPPPIYLSPSSIGSPSSLSSQSLYPLYGIAERMEAAANARANLSKDPSLNRLYEKFVERRFTPRQGSRNSDLIALITFGFRAMGETMLFRLVRAFYEVNQDIFTDSLDQHMKEANAHFECCRRNWLMTLPANESAIANNLPQKHAEAFRICRDLAHLDLESPPGRFFLSYSDLGDRLGIDLKSAHRLIHQLLPIEFMKITENGTRWRPGERSKATRYVWTLDLPLGSSRSG